MENRIKEVAKLKGVTQAQIANKTGIAVVTITAYYTQNRKPSLHNLVKIAEVLECNPLELLEAGSGYGHFYHNGNWEGVRKI